MITLIIIQILVWWLIGAVSMAWSIHFNWDKIKSNQSLFLFGSFFGPIIAALLIFDNSIDKDENIK